jgi:cell division protein FtsB
MEETKLKNRIKLISVICALVLFILLSLLVFEYIKFWQLKNKENQLNQRIEELSRLKENYTNEVDYKQSDAYIEEYAREVLGYGKNGEVYSSSNK